MGRKVRKCRSRGCDCQLSSAFTVNLTGYPKSLRAGLCLVSKLDHFIKSLESAFDLNLLPTCRELHNLSLSFSISSGWIFDKCRDDRLLTDYKKKKGNLEPNLKDVTAEGNFHTIAPNPHQSERESRGRPARAASQREWTSLTVFLRHGAF